jgi:hypothetical protein
MSRPIFYWLVTIFQYTQAIKGVKTDQSFLHTVIMVGRTGFEPVKAVPTDLQSVPFDRSGISPDLHFLCVSMQDSMSLMIVILTNISMFFFIYQRIMRNILGNRKKWSEIYGL